MDESAVSYTHLDVYKRQVLNSIQSQGLLTDKLESEIVKASTQTELEDLYQPYRPKRRTRAGVARKKGLLPLAQMIIQQTITEDVYKRQAHVLRHQTDSGARG